MHTKYRALTVAGSIAAVSIGLAGCGGSSGPNTLQLKQAGTLKVAFRSDDKPASFVQDGNPAGFDIDLMKAIAKEMDLKVSFVSTDFDSMVPNVRNHVYDTAAFGVLLTSDREKVADFTTPMSYGQAQLISLKKAPLSTVADATGKRVAVTTGSALIPLLQKTSPGVVVRQFPNVASSANALESGQVAGLFTGDATTAELLEQHDDFTASQKIVSGTDAFPVAKDHKKLRAALNKALTTMMNNGTYTKLFDKWNPKGIAIPTQLFKDYPGLKQRPGVTASDG